MATKKRSADQVRAAVQEQLLRENFALNNPSRKPVASGASGAIISGADLLKVKAKIDLIPDEADRKKLLNIFGTFTKNQSLAMILDANGPWARKYPDLVVDIADEATATDQLIHVRQS